jgi:AcrR family transcriptional regulator
VFNPAPSDRSGAAEFAGGRSARQQRYRDATRRAILDAALQLFVVDGYATVSMRSIASRVGYTAGAIYSYFSSKDEIFFALADEGFRLQVAREQAAPPGASAIEDLKAGYRRLYAFSVEQPQYFALLFLDRHVPRITREYETFAFQRELRAQMLRRMERCIAEGELPAHLDVALASRLLFVSVMGIASLRVSNRLPSPEEADLLLDHAIEVGIAGLRTAEPRRATEPTASGISDSSSSSCHS